MSGKKGTEQVQPNSQEIFRQQYVQFTQSLRDNRNRIWDTLPGTYILEKIIAQIDAIYTASGDRILIVQNTGDNALEGLKEEFNAQGYKTFVYPRIGRFGLTKKKAKTQELRTIYQIHEKLIKIIEESKNENEKIVVLCPESFADKRFGPSNPSWIIARECYYANFDFHVSSATT